MVPCNSAPDSCTSNTFWINLVQVGEFEPNPADNVSIPRTNADGNLARANEIDKVTEFVHALADTVQNWADSMQARVPS